MNARTKSKCFPERNPTAYMLLVWNDGKLESLKQKQPIITLQAAIIIQLFIGKMP